MKPNSDQDHPSSEEQRRSLSAAADGEADAVGPACRAWAEDADARASWHAYHLIGDVMRSSELASEAGRDAAFLSRLHSRLADEPVVLAPPARPSLRFAAWRVPAAMAAGFALAAGVALVVSLSRPSGESSGLVAQLPASESLLQVSEAGSPGLRPAMAQGALIRDARLDELLRAHQSARGGMASAIPASALRRVDAESTAGTGR